jgi:hypothetical protein
MDPFLRPTLFSSFGNILRNRETTRAQIIEYWDLLEEKDGTKKAAILFVLFELNLTSELSSNKSTQ